MPGRQRYGGVARATGATGEAGMKTDVVVERGGPSPVTLQRWSGLALVAGGPLMVVGVALHPSRETAATILAAEGRLVTAHGLFTLAYLLLLLGLPGLYLTGSVRMGRLGLAGFLLAFTGTMLIAVSGNFGFLAPVLAADAPATIDTVNRYLPVAVLNAVAFTGFVVGFVLLGTAMASRTTLPRACGLLIAVGAPAQVLGFGLAQLASPAWWALAILGTLALAAGLAWPGYGLWRRAGRLRSSTSGSRAVHPDEEAPWPRASNAGTTMTRHSK